MMDSKGLITSKRTSLEHHKLNYAHEVAGVSNTRQVCIARYC